MIIDYDLTQYIVHEDDDISKAVNSMIEHQKQIVFSISQKGQLEGLLSNGDIMRWLAKGDSLDLSKTVSSIANQKFLSARFGDNPEEIESLLEKVLYLPLVDKSNHLIAVARKRSDNEGIKIGKFTISDRSPAFIIAEIGINHNGSLEQAKRLIDLAVSSGADCAKFQMRDMQSLYSNKGDSNDEKENLGAQYVLDILSKFQLSKEDMFKAFDYCKKKGIMPLCTPWDIESLKALEAYGMLAYKVASADLTNHDFLIELAKTGKPLICSTGMSSESEIMESVSLLKHYGAQYALLHCNSTYPAPFKDINLKYISRLKEIGGCVVGYSGHERGQYVSIAAVAMGAKIIERHFTFDKTLEGNDHKVSLLPDEFSSMVSAIREVEQSLGEGEGRSLSQGEMMNRVTLAKSLIINCDLKSGEIIENSMIEIKSPGRGLQPNKKKELIGKIAKRDFKKGDFFFPSDLVEDKVKARTYKFNRPWGVPVRYHDFKTILAKSNPDFLEFHLSFKDMEKDIKQYFDREYNMGLVVHSPDFFTGDFLLDLSSKDEKHRKRSIEELQRVVNITRELKGYFKKAEKPFVVASVGGFTRNKLIEPDERYELYEILAKSLLEIDQEGIEIIPQTLPPFPWYFGGQLYLNLFVDPKDTAEFCKKYGYRICLDICHSKLACNNFKWSFKKFLKEVGRYVAHLHISDATGVDGEGIQVGEGDMDFPALLSDIDEFMPKASFIPEIWQGHENEGEGFWIALERLEQIGENK